jgi:hypothetical protein
MGCQPRAALTPVDLLCLPIEVKTITNFPQTLADFVDLVQDKGVAIQGKVLKYKTNRVSPDDSKKTKESH